MKSSDFKRIEGYKKAIDHILNRGNCNYLACEECPFNLKNLTDIKGFNDFDTCGYGVNFGKNKDLVDGVLEFMQLIREDNYRKLQIENARIFRENKIENKGDNMTEDKYLGTQVSKKGKSEIELFGKKYEVDKERLLEVLRDNGIIDKEVEMFIPKLRENHFVVEKDGSINIYRYDNIIPVEGRTIKSNNAYKTEEEAKIKSDINKSVFRMIENLMIAENIKTGYVADYENDKTDKCCFYYSHLEERWYVTNYKNITTGYCTSPESAEKILKYLKDNNIKPQK